MFTILPVLLALNRIIRKQVEALKRNIQHSENMYSLMQNTVYSFNVLTKIEHISVEVVVKLWLRNVAAAS